MTKNSNDQIEWAEPSPNPTAQKPMRQFVEALKLKPGTAIYKRNVHNQTAANLKRYPGVEATSRHLEDDDPGKSTVYARWVGEQ